MKIQVYIRFVYGKQMTYVADPSQARLISALTGAKTLEHRHLIALEGLGHIIEQVSDPLTMVRSAAHYGSK